MTSKTTIASLSREVTTEAEAYAYLEALRWKGTPVCPHCQGADVYLIQPKNGASRKTRTGTLSERRVWKCRSRECGKQFSVLTGTVMSGTKIPVRVWVLVFFEFVASKNGVAAREIERKYGVCPRTAWHLLHRIREAMRGDNVTPFRGVVVVADETFIGGEPKNMHASKRPEVTGKGYKKGRGYSDQTPVLSLVSVGLDKNEVRSRVVPNVRGATLRKAIAEQVVLPEITLFTDTAGQYRELTPQVVRHVMVNHSKGEYVKRGAGTNWAENYFSQLKRSLDGTHHAVSKKHLNRYLAEFDYRYDTCKITDTERMARLLGQVEGRLTYAMLKRG